MVTSSICINIKPQVEQDSLYAGLFAGILTIEELHTDNEVRVVAIGAATVRAPKMFG